MLFGLSLGVFDGGVSRNSYPHRHGIFIKIELMIHVSSFRTDHEHKCQTGTVMHWFEAGMWKQKRKLDAKAVEAILILWKRKREKSTASAST